MVPFAFQAFASPLPEFRRYPFGNAFVVSSDARTIKEPKDPQPLDCAEGPALESPDESRDR
jgi:hypothetical protein